MKYTLLKVHGREHVLKSPGRERGTKLANGEELPMPNYMGTGLALCGILRQGETLEDFKKRVREFNVEDLDIDELIE